MTSRITRLSVLAALMSVFALAASASAASADTVTCTNNATIKLSPGLEATPQVQNISIKGTLTGCSGTETTVTGGSYVAHLKTTQAVGCSALTGAGAATGNIILKWSPKGGGNSGASFTMPLTEVAGASLGGLVETGLFAADSISGTVSQTYTGGAKCGVAEGKKKGKKVNKGSLTGTLSIS